jgi:hypothetical protein
MARKSLWPYKSFLVNQIDYILQFCPVIWVRFRTHITILEGKARSIGNAQLFSCFNISEGCICDKEVLEIPLPADVLMKGGVVEHASEAEDDGLRC